MNCVFQVEAKFKASGLKSMLSILFGYNSVMKLLSHTGVLIAMLYVEGNAVSHNEREKEERGWGKRKIGGKQA